MLLSLYLPVRNIIINYYTGTLWICANRIFKYPPKAYKTLLSKKHKLKRKKLKINKITTIKIILYIPFENEICISFCIEFCIIYF